MIPFPHLSSLSKDCFREIAQRLTSIDLASLWCTLDLRMQAILKDTSVVMQLDFGRKGATLPLGAECYFLDNMTHVKDITIPDRLPGKIVRRLINMPITTLVTSNGFISLLEEDFDIMFQRNTGRLDLSKHWLPMSKSHDARHAAKAALYPLFGLVFPKLEYMQIHLGKWGVCFDFKKNPMYQAFGESTAPSLALPSLLTTLPPTLHTLRLYDTPGDHWSRLIPPQVTDLTIKHIQHGPLKLDPDHLFRSRSCVKIICQHNLIDWADLGERQSLPRWPDTLTDLQMNLGSVTLPTTFPPHLTSLSLGTDSSNPSIDKIFGLANASANGTYDLAMILPPTMTSLVFNFIKIFTESAYEADKPIFASPAKKGAFGGGALSGGFAWNAGGSFGKASSSSFSSSKTINLLISRLPPSLTLVQFEYPTPDSQVMQLLSPLTKLRAAVLEFRSASQATIGFGSMATSPWLLLSPSLARLDLGTWVPQLHDIQQLPKTLKHLVCRLNNVSSIREVTKRLPKCYVMCPVPVPIHTADLRSIPQSVIQSCLEFNYAYLQKLAGILFGPRVNACGRFPTSLIPQVCDLRLISNIEILVYDLAVNPPLHPSLIIDLQPGFILPSFDHAKCYLTTLRLELPTTLDIFDLFATPSTVPGSPSRAVPFTAGTIPLSASLPPTLTAVNLGMTKLGRYVDLSKLPSGVKSFRSTASIGGTKGKLPSTLRLECLDTPGIQFSFADLMGENMSDCIYLCCIAVVKDFEVLELCERFAGIKDFHVTAQVSVTGCLVPDDCERLDMSVLLETQEVLKKQRIRCEIGSTVRLLKTPRSATEISLFEISIDTVPATIESITSPFLTNLQLFVTQPVTEVFALLPPSLLHLTLNIGQQQFPQVDVNFPDTLLSFRLTRTPDRSRSVLFDLQLLPSTLTELDLPFEGAKPLIDQHNLNLPDLTRVVIGAGRHLPLDDTHAIAILKALPSCVDITFGCINVTGTLNYGDQMLTPQALTLEGPTLTYNSAFQQVADALITRSQRPAKVLAWDFLNFKIPEGVMYADFRSSSIPHPTEYVGWFRTLDVGSSISLTRLEISLIPLAGLCGPDTLTHSFDLLASIKAAPNLLHLTYAFRIVLEDNFGEILPRSLTYAELPLAYSKTLPIILKDLPQQLRTFSAQMLQVDLDQSTLPPSLVNITLAEKKANRLRFFHRVDQPPLEYF